MFIITKSIFIPKDCIITDLTCEFLEEENTIVKNVQYQRLENGKEDIVDSISRRVVFNLNDKNFIERFDDYGLMFYIKYQEPNNEMASFYRIDLNNCYVYKVSHLMYEIDGVKKFILSANKFSYISILKYLQEHRRESISSLIVKNGDNYIPFIDLDIQKFVNP